MPQISKIFLSNFRNFLSKKIEFHSPLVLFVGRNGAGKTNILEALSLLGRNSPLRNADFDEMIFDDMLFAKATPQFAIYAEIFAHEFIEKIGLSFDLQQRKKFLQINGDVLNSRRQSDIKNHLINFIWLTPQLEQLFALGKSERRDYLDKIVGDIDLHHQSRIGSYQKLLRERLLILQKYQNSSDKKLAAKWLDAVENNIVELGVAIASGRIEAIDFFNKAIASFASNFPKPKLQVIGDIENEVIKQRAVALEEFYKNKLTENRSADAKSFKTEFGVHRADFDAVFLEKNSFATRSSTGEQKAIMIGITLARAKISAAYKNQPTILLFDEVASHLDDKRKDNLFAEVAESKIQSFFSATSSDLIPQQYLNQIQLVNL